MFALLGLIGLWLLVVWALHDDGYDEPKKGMSNLNIFTRFDNND